ncbi:hypothetical protein P7H22_26630 [Paenibacillus larvae]|nr:hypothetical protein [Paenibacillus larvae]MDT2243183.1 hypothetical protein [Paenibacillus larvae]
MNIEITDVVIVAVLVGLLKWRKESDYRFAWPRFYPLYRYCDWSCFTSQVI